MTEIFLILKQSKTFLLNHYFSVFPISELHHPNFEEINIALECQKHYHKSVIFY